MVYLVIKFFFILVVVFMYFYDCLSKSFFKLRFMKQREYIRYYFEFKNGIVD